MAGKGIAGFLILAAVMLVPATGWAQSGFAGVVKDTTGAVLPGVTVEASSPALIEKVRTAVTDGVGQYKIVDVRPGTYTVTFTLAGFSAVKREGIELPANFTATVNAELRVGDVAETITVTGASPVVDVKNTVPQTTIHARLLATVPSAGGIMAYVALTPGILVSGRGQDVGGSLGEQRANSGTIHGSKENDNRLMLDGMRYSSAYGSARRGLYPNPAQIEEVVVELGLGSAESELGGVSFNTIPKEGGNTFRGHLYANYANEHLQGNNLTDDLRARGLTLASGVKGIYDYRGNFGGPLKADRLWFFTAGRVWGSENYVAGLYENKDPQAWTYTPDLSRPATFDEDHRASNLRLTWQASPRNKFGFSYDWQHHCNCHFTLDRGDLSPEAASRLIYKPDYMVQATWKQTTSNRLLLEAGGTYYRFTLLYRRQPGVTPQTISVRELSRNLVYRAKDAGQYGPKDTSQSNYRFSVSFVTGSHAFKTGLFFQEADLLQKFEYNSDMDFRFLNGVPSSLTQYATPFITEDHLKANVGIYAQDQWTIQRLTLNLGLRFDYLNAYVPPQSLDAGRFVPARNFAQVDCVPCWMDINPRAGASYDLFGNGKTAIKGSVGRYVASEVARTASANNPVQTSVASTTRTWNDSFYPVGDLRRGNFAPDCDLTNFAANGECGTIDNVNFGRNNPRATTYASDVLTGWGSRSYNWQASASVQQELRAGVAVTAGYFRTWHGNFQRTDNLAVAPADFDQYSITAPVDARLPGGGGFPITGLYDINPSKFGLSQNVVTQASHFGKPTEVFDGIDLTFNARLPRGALLSGGVTTGRTVTNNCVVVDDPSVLRFCEVTLPWRAQTALKLVGTYTLPWDIQASAMLQSLPGAPITASYVATNAEIAPSLRRNLAAGARGTALVELIEPNTQFEGRINQLDTRVSKIFRVGRATFQGMVDVYNLFNASPVLLMVTRYGPAWRRPTQILEARFVKFGVQMDF